MCRIETKQMVDVEQWVAQRHADWERRLDRPESFLRRVR